jgi:hypothetical protein
MNHKVDAASSDDMIFCLIKMQKNKKSAMPQNPKHSGRYVHNKKNAGSTVGSCCQFVASQTHEKIQRVLLYVLLNNIKHAYNNIKPVITSCIHYNGNVYTRFYVICSYILRFVLAQLLSTGVNCCVKYFGNTYLSDDKMDNT